MKALFYIVLFNFAHLTSLFAQEPIDLIHHIEGSYIGKNISYFEDKDGTYSIQSIDSLPDELFTANKYDIINFGFSKSVFWLRFVVTNKDSLTNWITEIRYPDLDYVTLYYKDENGIWREKNDGDTWPFYQRDINSRNIAFKLPSVNRIDSEYYFRIKSMGPITIPLKIERIDFFESERVKSEVFYGIFYGIMLIMLFYNLFIYFSIRETRYIYYILTIACLILFYGYNYGHIPQYITHFKSPALINLLPLIGSLLGIAGLQFAKVFLNLVQVSPFFYRLVNLIQLLYFLNALLLFIDPVLSYKIKAFLIIFSAITALLAGIVVLKKGNREARFFIFGWGFYFFALFIFVLNQTGLIPGYEFVMDILLIGSITEISLQSFALADKINIYRWQKEQAQEQIIHLREEEAVLLEQKVKERTVQLENANEEIRLTNKDLESFSYSVSHDLRAPARAMHGFSTILEEKYNNKLFDEEGKEALSFLLSESIRMGNLIDDLLAFSRLGKKEIQKSMIDMTVLANNALNDVLKFSEKKYNAKITINNLPSASCDGVLIQQVFVNLISNALKFSSTKQNPIIEIGSFSEANTTTYYVKDNGVGFDMKYYDKLFGVFQRLHDPAEFPGTGIGLAIVQRIIIRHGGSVRAEGKINEGSTFYFTLPK